MQKREMTEKEKYRETIMKSLNRKEIDAREASLKLGVSIRQVKRIKRSYGEKGAKGLIHQSRGVQGGRKISQERTDKIVRIIREQYGDFGPLLACEKLTEVYEMKYDPETIRKIMMQAGIWKGRKKAPKQYRAWRERKAAYGELEQFDGSYHNWFEGRNQDLPEACLLASIDDATGKITHAVFGKNEGVEEVFRFWKSYIVMHGVPMGIYLDKFSTYKINHSSAVDNHDLMTQFQRASKDLGMQLITAHSPQAKGRIERLFQTLQDRLVKELRLRGISTIAEANTFLKEEFIPWFNQRYNVVPTTLTDVHKTITQDLTDKLPEIFSIQNIRNIANDFTIRFKNVFYQLKEIQPTTVYKTDKVNIEERLDKTIHFKYKGYYLNAFVLPERPAKQNTHPTILTTHKLNWKPPHNHPWRQYIINSG